MNFADQFHDACGMGIFAHMKTRSSQSFLYGSVHALARMTHRASFLCFQ